MVPWLVLERINKSNMKSAFRKHEQTLYIVRYLLDMKKRNHTEKKNDKQNIYILIFFY